VDERLDRMIRNFFAAIVERIGLIYIPIKWEEDFFNVHKSMY